MENTLLNLVPASYLPEVHLSQYDVGRELKFTLKDGSSDYTVPSGAVVTVKATKPSGLGFVVNAVADGNVVTLSNTETMTNENGRFPAELSITQGSTVIGTSNFIFNIERSPHPEGTIDGDAESLLPELTLLVERIEAAADSVDEDTQIVTESKAEVLQAKADTLQAKADTLSARDESVSAKDLAVSSAQTSVEASQRAEQLVGSVETKADAIVKTASGEIASFTDGGDDLPMKSLKVNIVPKQSGSGDPSPQNIRPISGTDTVEVVRTGKNLIDMDLPYTTTSSGITNHWAREFKLPKVGSWIRCSGKCSDGTALTDIALVWINGDTQIWNIGPQRGFQVPSNINEVTRVRLFTPATYAGKTVTEFQIEYVEGESSTATAYEPYQGTSYPISLGQTVYGGTLEVMSGKLTIDKALVDMGTLNWTYNAQYHAFYTYDLTSVIKKGANIKADILCSIYPVDNDADPFDRNKVISSTTVWAQGNIIVVDDSYTSSTAFKTAMNGVQLVYELATPIEVTLTPTEVKTLLGNNNIFADSGSVEVEYRADTTLAYNELLSLIASL